MRDKPVSQIMSKCVWTASVDDTVEKVEEILTHHRLSSLPVVDADGKVFGVISVSDLAHFHVARKNAKAVHAWEMCTYKPIEVGPHMSIGEVASLMVKNKIHHVVVTENMSLLGFVSSLDFVEQYTLRDPPPASPGPEWPLAAQRAFTGTTADPPSKSKTPRGSE